MTKTTSTATRCDSIISLIDSCLADVEASARPALGNFENVLRSLTRSFPNMLPGELRAVALDLCSSSN